MKSHAAATELKTQEMARSVLYLKLAKAFRPPNSSLPELIRDLESTAAKLESPIAGKVLGLSNSIPTPEKEHDLAVDYAHLFAGPFKAIAPPYGSVYLEDKMCLMGDSSMDARRHYLSLGLDLAEDFKEPPDHISTELEFVHVLICKTLKAIETWDPDLFTDSIEQRRTFLNNHLGAWLPPFADRVIKGAQTPFYRTLVSFTTGFVTEEIETLPEISYTKVE